MAGRLWRWLWRMLDAKSAADVTRKANNKAGVPRGSKVR